jgi:hypothetical protein
LTFTGFESEHVQHRQLVAQPIWNRERSTAIETLARIAARAAGRDPDERVQVVLGKTVAFDDVVWRYDDFLLRAEAAFDALTAPPFPVI